MTPEKKVKLKICAILKEMGAYYFYASTGVSGLLESLTLSVVIRENL
jgi:hypothetical protein